MNPSSSVLSSAKNLAVWISSSIHSQENNIMGFHALQIHLTNLVLLLIVASASSLAATIPPKFPIAKPNCTDRCGNVSIPFPFGTTENCYHSNNFFVTCNQTFNPPKAFMKNSSSVEIIDISLDGQLKVLIFIAHACYDQNRTSFSHNYPWAHFPIPFIVNNTANKVTIVGCDAYGYVYGRRFNRDYTTGCIAMCDAKDDVEEGSCMGLGCCQTSIPKQVWSVNITVYSYYNYSHVRGLNNCSYAFLAEESAFTFSPESLINLKNVEKLPMVIDWTIGNGTCEEAKMNSSTYACKSANSGCYKPNNGYGYRCSCLPGYHGNPYLNGGCRDIDECQDPNVNICEERCINTPGSFNCACPKGYRGDGKRGGQGCVRGESLVLKLVAGIASAVTVLLLTVCYLHLEVKRRRLIKMRHKFFLQNGGLILQEKLTTRQRSSDTARIFNASELQKATKNFHDSMIIGQGGFGTVYKGVLPDNAIVAIKKAKEVDPNQIDQFTNEVIVLSQINHRNVVKLLGCCLETQAPLLVYELVSNGNLFQHIHNEAKVRFLSWGVRLKIATEVAGVLSYLHSAASTPIIHRDIKSANILLDQTLTAKVSDFGTSRLIPLDQTEVTTLVQGTWGYLDPEYIQTQQLTEKSDVYSFGVVLVELLTGKKAVSNDRPEEERNLANFFLRVMKEEDLLSQVLDDNVVTEENKEVVMKVAVLAKRCLSVKGDERPSMKEVAMELEGLRVVGREHPWVETEHIVEDKEALIGKEFSSFIDADGCSTSSGIYSLGDHSILQVHGGR